MLKLKKFCSKEWNRFKEEYLKIFILVLIIFIVAAFLSHFLLVKHPDQAQKSFFNLAKMLSKKIPVEATIFKKCLLIFYSNSRASLFAILFGFIPFLFFPILSPLLNGSSMGIITSILYIKKLKVLPNLVLAVAPHGIFELPAIFYANSLGIFLSLQVTKKILYQNHGQDLLRGTIEEKTEPLLPVLKRILKTWLSVIVPLLFMAAVTETFVTPILAEIFLKR